MADKGLKQNNCYLIGKKEIEFIDKEVTSLLKKERLWKTSHHGNGEFIFWMFAAPKSDGGFRVMLNLKKFDKQADYKKFKTETKSIILSLI